VGVICLCPSLESHFESMEGNLKVTPTKSPSYGQEPLRLFVQNISLSCSPGTGLPNHL
jgi:hypothetical protein